MPSYQIFTPAIAQDFANEHSDLFGLHSKLTTVLLKESRQNLVFRVKNQFGRSLIVKQALPYHHAAGPQTPLTVDRARVEAEVLQRQRNIAPDQVVEILHFCKEQSAILMEDLHDHQQLHKALVVGRELPNLATQLAEYLARSSFYSSDFAQSSAVKRAGMARFLNPELCQITEELAFTDPYGNHSRNNVAPALRDAARSLWQNEAIKTAVATLKLQFTSNPQALIHGDLQCSSIFVNDNSVKVTDAEFGCYGPIAFDLGRLIGSLLTVYFSIPALIPTIALRQQQYILGEIRQLWLHFADVFLQLAHQETRDLSLQSMDCQRNFVSRIQHDAIGYAATELIRRVIGMESIRELRQSKDEQASTLAQNQMLQVAEQLLLQYPQFQHIDEVVTLVTTTPSR